MPWAREEIDKGHRGLQNRSPEPKEGEGLGTRENGESLNKNYQKGPRHSSPILIALRKPLHHLAKALPKLAKNLPQELQRGKMGPETCPKRKNHSWAIQGHYRGRGKRR